MIQEKDVIALERYLATHKNKDVLKFLTCGSVDDGKSTLIGRLLHDSKQIFQDQLAAIKNDSRKYNTTDQEFDLALLVDGLQSEREQGITIDVAYRYFYTDKRKFIIADSPGHEQYTRNMATGASHCNLAIILIDARSGVKAQTRRHSYICSLLGIKNIVVAINKMDLVGYSQVVFEQIKEIYRKDISHYEFNNIHYIPLSALRGDNVVELTSNMSWYQGVSLLSYLEQVPVTVQNDFDKLRFPVQYVNRPDSAFRGFSGTIASGRIVVGDRIKIMPSLQEAKIARIVHFDGDQISAQQDEAITITLDKELDISRGDLVVHVQDRSVQVAQYFNAQLVWLNELPMQLHRQYEILLGTNKLIASIEDIEYRVDINDCSHHASVNLNLNEIGLCCLKLTKAVALDIYKNCNKTGSFILIDRMNNATVAAGMIQSIDAAKQELNTNYSEFELGLNALICKHFPHWEAKNLSELLK